MHLILASLALTACKKEDCAITGSEDSPWKSVSVGGTSSCGIHEDGSLQCWGGQYEQELCPPVESFAEVSVGAKHACGITTGGEALCWGTDIDGSTEAPSGTFEHITAGENWSCATGASGVSCWGNDEYGQASPPELAASYVSIDAGQWHTCAVTTEGEMICWGTSLWGVLDVPELDADDTGDTGDTGDTDDTGPSEPSTWVAVSVGWAHSCGLDSAQEIHCWGGSGDFADDGLTAVPEGTYTDLSAGAYATCGLSTESTLACWGRDTDGIVDPVTVPTVDVALGGSTEGQSAHACAITDGGDRIRCWGAEDDGQGIAPGEVQ